MLASRPNIVALRQALPSQMLHNVSKRSLAPSSTPHFIKRPHRAPHRPSKAFFSSSSSSGSLFPQRLSRSTPRRPSPSAVAASLTLGSLYSLSWFLEIPPHNYIPDLLFDPRDDAHTMLDEAELAAVSYPDSFDFTNDHFFNTLARARPLKYGHYLRQTQKDIQACREAVAALEAALRKLVVVEPASPWDRERWRIVEEELASTRESLLLCKTRWLRLFILDQREGAWRTQPGFKRRTVESVVREWMGRDVENLVGEFVRMGLIDVRAD